MNRIFELLYVLSYNIFQARCLISHRAALIPVAKFIALVAGYRQCSAILFTLRILHVVIYSACYSIRLHIGYVIQYHILLLKTRR